MRHQLSVPVWLGAVGFWNRIQVVLAHVRGVLIALSHLGLFEAKSATQGLVSQVITSLTLPGEGAPTMVTRLGLICLCLGILSTVNGCYVDPSPSDNLPYYGAAYYGVDMHPETSQGHSDGRGIDYERQMDEQEQQYRRQRSLQERAPEPMYQQWEREQERVRDPRQGG